jgi:hypothetical protein
VEGRAYDCGREYVEIVHERYPEYRRYLDGASVAVCTLLLVLAYPGEVMGNGLWSTGMTLFRRYHGPRGIRTPDQAIMSRLL